MTDDLTDDERRVCREALASWAGGQEAGLRRATDPDSPWIDRYVRDAATARRLIRERFQPRTGVEGGGDMSASDGVAHDLKTWPEPFQAVWSGIKTCEFRRDDRGYAVGDTLILHEYDPGSGLYSGRGIAATVTDIRRGGAFGIPDGYVMLSIAVRSMVAKGDDRGN